MSKYMCWVCDCDHDSEEEATNCCDHVTDRFKELRQELTQAKAELAAARAECERLREDATVKAGRLLYIADNINDNVAVRFGLEAREDEIIAVMKDAGWPIDARKAQP